MTAAVIFALIAGFSVATVLRLLYRLNRFQRPEPQQAPRSIFLRR